jgi:hypothetical protein
MSDKKNTDAEITSAHAWLEAVSAELGTDPQFIRSLTRELLDLTKHVAHGPSRPAAPLTAFLVGVAAGKKLSGEESTEEAAAATRDNIDAVEALLARYQGGAHRTDEEQNSQ